MLLKFTVASPSDRLPRHNRPNYSVGDFGSINWAVRVGERSSRILNAIAAEGKSAARREFAFYGDQRVAENKSRRAAHIAPQLADAAPALLIRQDNTGVIIALDWIGSIDEGRPIYLPLKTLGRTRTPNPRTPRLHVTSRPPGLPVSHRAPRLSAASGRLASVHDAHK